MIADYDGDFSKLLEIKPDNPTPILTTRNLVIFPGIMIPIVIGRQTSLNLIDKLQKSPETIVAIVSQRDPGVEEPRGEDIYDTGVYARLMKVIELPGNGRSLTAIFQGLGRCRIVDVLRNKPYMLGQTILDNESFNDTNSKEFQTAMEDLRTTVAEYVKENDELPDDTMFALNGLTNDMLTINFVCTNLPFSVVDKIRMLRASSMMERLYETLRTLNKERQFIQLKQNIRTKTREDIDEQQREYFLQQQIKNLKEELGNGEGSQERRNWNRRPWERSGRKKSSRFSRRNWTNWTC